MILNDTVNDMEADELRKLSISFDVLGNYHKNISDLLQTLFLLKTAKNLELTISGKAENGSDILYSTKSKDTASKALEMCIDEHLKYSCEQIELAMSKIIEANEAVNG